MSDIHLSESAKSNRLVQALMQVSDDLTKSVIEKALHTHTPVITTDDQGNILRLDAKELARQYRIEDSTP
jgi:hypothetical protein